MKKVTTVALKLAVLLHLSGNCSLQDFIFKDVANKESPDAKGHGEYTGTDRTRIPPHCWGTCVSQMLALS